MVVGGCGLSPLLSSVKMARSNLHLLEGMRFRPVSYMVGLCCHSKMQLYRTHTQGQGKCSGPRKPPEEWGRGAHTGQLGGEAGCVHAYESDWLAGWCHPPCLGKGVLCPLTMPEELGSLPVPSFLLGWWFSHLTCGRFDFPELARLAWCRLQGLEAA